MTFFPAQHPGGALQLEAERSQQQVSLFHVILLQELQRVCVLRVSIYSLLNLVSECHFEWAVSLVSLSVVTYSVKIYDFAIMCIIVFICCQSWSGISEGKVVIIDGGCHQLLREQVMECHAVCPLYQLCSIDEEFLYYRCVSRKTLVTVLICYLKDISVL
jgi:hypothetical protein